MFTVTSSSSVSQARRGVLSTPHGQLESPFFMPIATKATVKTLSSFDVERLGSPILLSNTYHLWLRPGMDVMKELGGLHRLMDWNEAILTDSGGFQVFSLGAAFGKTISKFTRDEAPTEEAVAVYDESVASQHGQLAIIDDEGVTFTSHHDGSLHRFTPERSVEIQHSLGADIFFAFDECTSPLSPLKYQREALDRTHRWAKRSLDEHKRLGKSNATNEMQALFGVVQGGAHEDLRKESAKTLGAMDFDGYGIGGSFTKEDMGTAVKWVCEELPVGKPRHLLGVGEPIDILLGIENGIDTFDCVSPTRIARNGAIYTIDGRINITNAKYKEDLSPVCDSPECYAHQFTKSYLSHLFRADEMLASTIASIHNLKFLTVLVDDARLALKEDRFMEFKDAFIKRYYAK